MNEISLAPPNVKVSVAMITYNHEPFIAQAIESVLMQETDFAVELVIGEDCSTDGTRAIARDYGDRYQDRIRLLLPKRNLGIIPNFVATLNACWGQYIALCEGDDYWIDPHKLQKQVDFLEAHPECSMCFHRQLARFEDGSNHPHVSSVPHTGSIFSLEDLIVESFIPTLTVMYRRGVVQDLPDWYFTVFPSDRPLHILHAQHGMIGFIDEIMAVYRVHEGGVWSMRSCAERLANEMDLYEKLRQHLGEEYAALIDAGVSKAYFREAGFCEWKGNLSGARAYLLRSIKEYPLNPHIHLIDRASMLVRLYAPLLHRILKWVQARLAPMWSPNRNASPMTSIEQAPAKRSDPSD